MSVKGRLLTDREMIKVVRPHQSCLATVIGGDYISLRNAQDHKTVNYILSNLPDMSEEEIIIAVCGYCTFEDKFSNEDCHACQRQLKGILVAYQSKIKELLEG